MSTTNTQSLDTLANEVWDFVGIAADHDLPALYKVELSRHAFDPGWTCQARIEGDPLDSAGLYESISAYARYLGAEVQFGKPYGPVNIWPSGKQRQLTVNVRYMGVEIELYALVDGTFELPAPVHVTGPMAGLLVGGELVNGEY